MTSTTLLDGLNSAQRQAVEAPPDQHVRVLAGAGSGKTRVLVHRIGWLLAQQHCNASRLLAVTFTNKAAREIRERISHLPDIQSDGLWVGTFHSIAYRLLRLHPTQANLPAEFQILDADDQRRMLRQLLRSQGIEERELPARDVAAWINRHKDRLQEPQPGHRARQQQMHALYLLYQQQCQRAGLIDFADLLLRALQLWQHASVRDRYRERFRFVLVDEFQDTNTAQYRWLQGLVGPQSRLFVVGDDDQAIYGWRGAVVDHLRDLQRDYPNILGLRLEQNYRSSPTILAAANALITHNQDRLGKALWTDQQQGEPLRLVVCRNAFDEADQVVAHIQSLIAQHALRYSDCAVLYRSNAQSRLFEERLLQSRLPYRVYGGLRFFERAEVRDLLAYLRLAVHPDDDAAFERVVNVPARGIGAATLQRLRETAEAQQATRWAVLAHTPLSARARNALLRFRDLIAELQRAWQDLPLDALIRLTLERSGLREKLAQSRDPRDQERLENLEELIGAAAEFIPPNEGEDPLRAFLAATSLDTGEGEGNDGDAVQLMTLHAAKGLEFPAVFLVGLEEGLFPNWRAVQEPERLEEERRLAYVGITRARQWLFLSRAEQRMSYGGEVLFPAASQFLRELPLELIQNTTPYTL